MHILVGLLGAVLSISGVLGYGKFQEYSQTFGALPLIQSAQLAASPSNGECLFSDGTANYWDTCSGGPGGGLSSYDAWTHPASGISATTSGMVFNSASSTFVGQLRAGHFFGNITGQSSTSLALAANGSNCSAGNFPLGVDASGAVESCTDAWTEAENTAAAYAAQATTLTIAGTAQQITSSAGAQSLAANRTWTLSLPSYVLFPGDIRATNSTTTNATTTSLAVTNLNSASCDVKASTSGVLSCGTDATGAGGTDPFTSGTTFGVLTAATSSRLWSQTRLFASSTVLLPNQLHFYDAEGGTTTNATSTNLSVSGTFTLFGTLYSSLATFANGVVNAVTAVTPTGTWDFGGATSLEMANGSSPTIDAVGEFALDTTANEFIFATSTNAGGAAVIKPFTKIGFTYSTTSWTGTTTIYLGPAEAAQDFQEARCETTTGTVNVSVYDGTNRMDLLNASTTIGTFKFSTNNNFTVSESRRVDIGTPASSPVKMACTFTYTYVRN